MKVYKEVPISEITLRKFEKPYESDPDKLIRKLCISIGLLQPGDSRDSIVDVIKVLINNRKERYLMNSNEISDVIRKNKDIAPSNIRRHLLRLEKVGLIEKLPEGYRIREWLPLAEVMDLYVKRFVIDPTYERILEYANKIDSI